jgi:hypothetical protein
LSQSRSTAQGVVGQLTFAQGIFAANRQSWGLAAGIDGLRAFVSVANLVEWEYLECLGSLWPAIRFAQRKSRQF